MNSSAGLPAACINEDRINLPPERSTQALLQVGWDDLKLWSSSGIAVLRIADRCLHYPHPRIV
ncbi:hypothetical protein AYI69_g8096, partial [Smittium culicis]